MRIGPFLILGRGDFLKYVYTEIKEEKRCRGCVISRLFIRYPEDVGNGVLNAFFKSQADRFYGYITENVFPKTEADFTSYLENGGRRSYFSPREFRLTVEAAEISENVICVKTEVLYTEKSSVKEQKNFSDLFDTKTGTVIRKRKARKIKV